MKRILCFSLLIITCMFCFGQESETIFSGIPSIKISEGGVERTVDKLEREKGLPAKCVISKIGDSYYWASRDNARLEKTESGAFIIFSKPGAYIKIIKPFDKAAASQMSKTEESYDYIEHVTVGLRTVTYYGKRQ